MIDMLLNYAAHGGGSVMMMLGTEYMFALSTAAYQSLRRSAEYRWPAQERIGRRPARQYVGPGGETIELSGSIYPQFAGGLAQVRRMRTAAGQGLPLLLVDGRGQSWGRWCIERVEETHTVLDGNGDPRRIDFALTLGRYGEDG